MNALHYSSPFVKGNLILLLKIINVKFENTHRKWYKGIMPRTRPLFQSFRASVEGLAAALRSERNLRLHMLAAIAAVALGLWLDLARWEWLVLILVIGFVLALELLNTAVEHVLDALIQYHHPKVKLIKDTMAATVLVSALVAVIIGLMIFIPHLLEKFR